MFFICSMQLFCFSSGRGTPHRSLSMILALGAHHFPVCFYKLQCKGLHTQHLAVHIRAAACATAYTHSMHHVLMRAALGNTEPSRITPRESPPGKAKAPQAEVCALESLFSQRQGTWAFSTSASLGHMSSNSWPCTTSTLQPQLRL